ncbi:MAG: hypothetical protein J6S08_05700 [Duodenibacillus sp.]|nr:hypothetical protein [Duodenibacillus sp.]
MAIRSVILIFLAAVAALFLVVNWPAIVAPVPVNLVYTEITAPLGLLLLIGFGTLWIVGIIWALLQRASTLMELRRAYKEANSSKSLADHAEQSRLEEARKALQEAVEGVDAKMSQRIESSAQIVNERLAGINASMEQLSKEVQSVESLLQEVRSLNAKVDALTKQLQCDVPETTEATPEATAKEESPEAEPKKGFLKSLLG